MRNLIILLFIMSVVQLGNAQAPNVDPGFKVKCGLSKTANVKLGKIIYCANGSGQNVGPIAEKQKLQRLIAAFFKKFPIFARALFKCDNAECPQIQCVKSVEVRSVRGTDPRFVSGEYHGDGKWSSIFRLKMKATCSDCEDGKPIPNVEPGKGEISVECDSDQSYTYPFFKHYLTSENEEDAQDEAEKDKELLLEMISNFPDLIDVQVNCIGNCDDSEVCSGSFSFEGLEIQGPAADEGGAYVNYYVTGTAKCSSCQKGDEDPKIIKRDIQNESGFYVYPNPASNHVHVDLIGLENGLNLRMDIIDIQGKLVDSKLVNPDQQNFTIEVSDMLEGIYFFTLIQDGVSLEQKKIVIKK